MERIESSETSTLKTQTLGDYPKNTIRHSTHGENLKSRYTFLLRTHCFIPFKWNTISNCMLCKPLAQLNRQRSWLQEMTVPIHMLEVPSWHFDQDPRYKDWGFSGFLPSHHASVSLQLSFTITRFSAIYAEILTLSLNRTSTHVQWINTKSYILEVYNPCGRNLFCRFAAEDVREWGAGEDIWL